MLWKQSLLCLFSMKEDSSSVVPPAPESHQHLSDRSTMSVSSAASSKSSLPRILCLHGKFQSASSFANKIGGARRKLQRVYDLHFLDAPLLVDDSPFGNADARAWWIRDEQNRHTLVPEAIEYVRKETVGKEYCAIIGFSQGGTLATALTLSGALRGIQAVITAGAPDAPDVFRQIETIPESLNIPKLHLAGETDDLVPPSSTQQLCERAGGGTFVMHEKGHLFPTKAAVVNHVLEFLQRHIQVDA